MNNTTAIVLVAAALVGGYFLLGNRQQAPMPIPEPSPAKQDTGSISLQISNLGSLLGI